MLPISQHCQLLAVSRSADYGQPAEVSAEDLTLIDRSTGSIQPALSPWAYSDHRAPSRSAHLPNFRAKHRFRLSPANLPVQEIDPRG
jgi:hypothetical protein